jgi:hypothetical protein
MRKVFLRDSIVNSYLCVIELSTKDLGAKIEARMKLMFHILIVVHAGPSPLTAPPVPATVEVDSIDDI